MAMNRRVLFFLTICAITWAQINGQFGGSSFLFSSQQNSPFSRYRFPIRSFNSYNFGPPFRSSFGSPFESSFGSHFGSSFGHGFPSMPNFGNFGFDISKRIEESMKPMKISQMKTQMQNGAGGLTIVQSPGKTLLKKDGVSFECLGSIIGRSPWCRGQIRRFVARSRQDYCYSEHYSQLGDALCIAHNEQSGISFNNNNGQYSCLGSDERPALLMSLQEYQNLCGKLPWQTTYYYFPDLSNPFHVKLPNPDLGCATDRPDVCAFQPNPKNLF